MLWESASLKIIDIAHHLYAVFVETDSLESLCLGLPIYELLYLGGSALPMLSSCFLFFFFVAVEAVFP